MRTPPVLLALARSFLAGKPSAEQIAARASHTLGKSWRWIEPLAQRYAESVAGRTRPRQREVIEYLLGDAEFERFWSKHSTRLRVEHWLAEPPQMQPVAAARTWKTPAIESPGALADWLGLSPTELEWFADLKRLGYRKGNSRLRHYHYRLLAKRSGAVRLIEAPKPRLKDIQQQILARILDEIPAHPASHGFVKGRSIKTCVAPHVGQRVLLRMDLRDYFPSFAAARIQTFFRTAGYPESVADLLGGLCTNVAPRDVWGAPGFSADPRELRGAKDLYSRPHLPQGAPTSPSLANLCTYRVDCRLAGLAKSAGPSIRAMPTIWPSRVERDSSGVWSGSRFTWRRSWRKRDSRCTIAKRVSCGRACASTWRDWSLTSASMSCGRISIG